MVSKEELENIYSDKKISAKEFLNMIEDVYCDYFTLFQEDKMNYTDFAILENVLIKIQMKVRDELLDE